ncbi:MAG: hypothetical protein ABII88_01720 [Candidatus Omnitrophota bacterium]
MIEINLLPLSYREAKSVHKNDLPVNLVLLVINATLIAILLILTSVNVYKTLTLRAIDTRLKNLEVKKQEIDNLKRKIDSFKQSSVLFEQVFTPEFLWSRMLNDLSDSLVPGVWFRSIALKRQTIKATINYVETTTELRFLNVSATVVSTAHDEMGVISGFMRQLKANKEFAELFKKIEVESVLRRKIADIEVMDFNLVCYFKDNA